MKLKSESLRKPKRFGCKAGLFELKQNAFDMNESRPLTACTCISHVPWDNKSRSSVSLNSIFQILRTPMITLGLTMS